MPDASGREAVGELPESVALGLFAADRELPEAILNAEFLVPRAGDHRILDLLGQMQELRVIQTLSAGVDRLLELVPAGVTLCDARGSRDVAVAEWVLATILASRKLLPELRDHQRAHDWAPTELRELAGSTVLILGYGSIGAAVEARLAPFEVEPIRVARRARAGVHPVEELGSLLGLADVVVVLLPLTPATEGLLYDAALSRMRQGALLVNAARGGVIDTEALLAALEAERLQAALDVTDPEPLAPEHPLWDAPGVLLTPHCAGDTAAAERRAFAIVGEQVRRYVRGEQLANVVHDGY
jgi:phosphoglycerate dehydrogenase-like enzyme